jgi:hypothetical protein
MRGAVARNMKLEIVGISRVPAKTSSALEEEIFVTTQSMTDPRSLKIIFASNGFSPLGSVLLPAWGSSTGYLAATGWPECHTLIKTSTSQCAAFSLYFGTSSAAHRERPGRRRSEAHRYWCGGNGKKQQFRRNGGVRLSAAASYEPNPPQAQATGRYLILSDKNHFKWE